MRAIETSLGLIAVHFFVLLIHASWNLYRKDRKKSTKYLFEALLGTFIWTSISAILLNWVLPQLEYDGDSPLRGSPLLIHSYWILELLVPLILLAIASSSFWIFTRDSRRHIPRDSQGLCVYLSFGIVQQRLTPNGARSKRWPLSHNLATPERAPVSNILHAEC